jgi:hypothetical protein
MAHGLHGRGVTRLIRTALVTTAVTAVTAAGATAATADQFPARACPPSSGTLAGGAVDWTLPLNPAFTSPTGYDIETVAPFWSVVATRGSQGGDPDVDLLSAPAACTVLGSSDEQGPGTADWVAFDNNPGRLPIGPYMAQVYDHQPYSGVTKHVTQFVAGSQVLSTADPTADQPVGFGASTGGTVDDWIVDIRDIYLTAGTSYTFTLNGGLDAMYVLQSSATDPSTWSGRRSTAAASVQLSRPDSNQPGTTSLEYRPAASGWYGALFVRDAWWGPAVTVRVSQAGV